MSSDRLRRFGALIAAALAAAAAHAQMPENSMDLTALSPEELGQLSISAASKRAEPLFASPSAVSALTSGEIGRFGFDSVADALRMVPGVQVMQGSAYRWGIGIRGFDGFSSTKLLVLMDGRTVYSPFYGGVDWAEANMQLQDLDRVEVVRGPGATLWGANAVNGVINIISKDSRDTQGAYLSLREGTTDGLDANLRYGGAIGDHAWYRVYLTETDTRTAPEPTAPDGNRYAFRALRAGFRADSEPSDTLHLTLQGEVTELRHFTAAPNGAGGEVDEGDSHRPENVLGRLHWQGAGGNELTVQVYADASPDSASPAAYRVPGGVGSFGIVDRGHEFDLDFTDNVVFGVRNDLIWGGGFRSTLIELANSSQSVLTVRSPRVTQDLYNFFAQDEIALAPSLLKLTLGSKLEHDQYIAWQALPSARLTFTPDANQTWWLAASHAIRSPSRSERDIRIVYEEIPPIPPATPPVEVTLDGSSAFHQEDLDAYEIGWRRRWGSAFSFDVTGYYNRYTNLRNLLPMQSLQFVPLLVHEDLFAVNTASADGYGVEASANWRVQGAWHVSASVTDERLMPKGLTFAQPFAPDFALPHEMASLRTWFDLGFDWQLSVAGYYVSGLRTSEYGVPDVPGYTRVDAQATWWPRTDLEVNAGVQNAFDDTHLEASPVSFFPSTYLRRNLFLQVQWRY